MRLIAGVLLAFAIAPLLPVAVFSQEPESFFLTGYYAYLDPIGLLHIVGEVENGYSTAYEFIQLTATVYDASNNTIAVPSAYADIWVLRPGERSSFEIILVDAEQSGKAAGYQISIDGNVIEDVKAGHLEIRSGLGRVDVQGYYHIPGVVVNNGPETATFVEVSGALYDTDGGVVGTARGFTDPVDIASGESARFELVSRSPAARITDTVSLNVQSEQYANAVVPEFPLPLLALVGGIAASIILRKR